MRVIVTVCAVVALAACDGRNADAGLTDICPQGCSHGLVCQQGQCVSPCTAAGGLLCGTVCANPAPPSMGRVTPRAPTRPLGRRDGAP